MSTITVKVTQAHIDTSTRRDGTRCAVGNAIKEVIDSNVHVMRCAIFIGSEEDCKMVAMPESVANFIDAYDDEQEVQPFEFELEVPE